MQFEGSVFNPFTQKVYKMDFSTPNQGSHMLEKYLNIQDCLEKSLKIKCVLKST